MTSMLPSSLLITSSAPASSAASISAFSSGAGREHELPAMLEEECDRAVGPEIAAVLGEGMPDIGDGPRTVVGHAIDDHRGAIDP
jgi:hypothetical protein